MIYNTVIFDMDGVVIDSGGLWKRSTQKLLAPFGIKYNPDEIRHKIAGTSLRTSTSILLDYYKLPIDLDNLLETRIRLVEEEYKLSLEFIPGFREFQTELNKIGIKTGIATSAYDGLVNFAISELKLLEIFNGHLYKASDVGNKSKPDPAIYLYAAEKLGSNPSECIVIEDAPNGISSAKNAGMKCIGISTTFSKDKLTEADIIIDKYKELDIRQLFTDK